MKRHETVRVRDRWNDGVTERQRHRVWLADGVTERQRHRVWLIVRVRGRSEAEAIIIKGRGSERVW